MNILTWLVFCLIFWWAGRNLTDIALLLIDNNRQLLTYPPRVLFLLCGAPTAKAVPRGVMTSKGLGLQISSILLMLEGFVLSVFHRMDGLAFVICFVPTFLIGLLISEFSRRFWPYSPA